MQNITFETDKVAHLSLDKEQDIENLIIVVRADPIICGHSTEARNLAEAAIKRGVKKVHIVSYPLDILEKSGLPLKPVESISPYSPGIEVNRPEPVGDYKVLDGRLSYAISGQIVELLYKLKGKTMVMDLYLVPHGEMVINAIRSFEQINKEVDIVTVGEAVGSDITNVVNNALVDGQFGAAQMVLSNYLAHDMPVAVSEFTKDLIVEAGRKVDCAIGSDFESQLIDRVAISYPAIDTAAYTSIENDKATIKAVLEKRNLDKDGYVMFLSRVAPAKGVDDLVDAYKTSELYGQKKLIICGNGPMKEEIIKMTVEDPHIFILDDVSDDEKGVLMHGCFAYCLPSKPKTEFVETFGIAIAEKMLAGGLGPVITTHTGGIPEASGGHCLEHEAGNIAELRECLDRVYFMTDEQRIKISNAAREFAMRFDRSQILQNLITLTAC